MRHIILGFFCLFVSVTFAESQQAIPMPKGFEQIRIGMEWSALITLRKNVELINMMPKPGEDLKPDPEKFKEGLTEILADGEPFERVLYSFENGILVAVIFGKNKEISQNDRLHVISLLTKQRGRPSFIKLMKDRHDQSILSWQDQTIHINAIVPTNKVLTDRSFITFQIMNRNYAKKIKALGIVNVMDRESREKNENRVALESLYSEIEAILKNENISEDTDLSK